MLQAIKFVPHANLANAECFLYDAQDAGLTRVMRDDVNYVCFVGDIASVAKFVAQSSAKWAIPSDDEIVAMSREYQHILMLRKSLMLGISSRVTGCTR